MRVTGNLVRISEKSVRHNHRRKHTYHSEGPKAGLGKEIAQAEGLGLFAAAIISVVVEFSDDGSADPEQKAE